MKTKEFFQKWKSGITSITPFQAAKITFYNTWMVILGIAIGMYYSITGAYWWLGLILIGALINTLVQQIGNYQKYKMLREFSSTKEEVVPPIDIEQAMNSAFAFEIAEAGIKLAAEGLTEAGLIDEKKV